MQSCMSILQISCIIALLSARLSIDHTLCLFTACAIYETGRQEGRNVRGGEIMLLTNDRNMPPYGTYYYSVVYFMQDITQLHLSTHDNALKLSCIVVCIGG